MVWFPKLLSGSGNTDFRINGAIFRCVFSFPRQTVRIAVFPDNWSPDKRGFTVLGSGNIISGFISIHTRQNFIIVWTFGNQNATCTQIYQQMQLQNWDIMGLSICVCSAKIGYKMQLLCLSLKSLGHTQEFHTKKDNPNKQSTLFVNYI